MDTEAMKEPPSIKGEVKEHGAPVKQLDLTGKINKQDLFEDKRLNEKDPRFRMINDSFFDEDLATAEALKLRQN